MGLDKDRITNNLDKLKKALKKGKKWRGPSDVHKLRTRIRHVQSELEAAKPYVKLSSGGLLRRLSRLHKKAGKVRDLDVLTGHLMTLQPEGEDDCRVQLQEYLGLERYREEKRLRRALRKNHAPIAKKLRESSRRLEKIMQKGTQEQTATAASALELSAKLSAPITLSRRNLHDYRADIKDLRDVLQLGQNSADDNFLAALKEAKDAIGEWHDWEELVLVAGEVLTHSPACKLLNELKDTARNKFEFALSLTNKLRKTYFNAPGRGRPPRARTRAKAIPRATRTASRLLA